MGKVVRIGTEGEGGVRIRGRSGWVELDGRVVRLSVGMTHFDKVGLVLLITGSYQSMDFSS